ncbi:MAG TPA: response regulator transcription factor [Thermoleophilaceae bacterium]|nr:response regulator transcription factor [Thermoleophilaceae bacterium]
MLIVDDHALVRAGLAELIGAGDEIEVVGLAESGDQALALAASEEPDVVLMDLSMPGIGGVEATRRIVAEHPGMQVVVLTSLSARERILEALDAGAIGYLLKESEPEELVRAVQAAARGESPLSPKAAQHVIAERTGQRPALQLSPREREVLDLVGQGLSNKLIARRLEISEKTVKAHLTQVFSQLGVSDRTQAALWIERNGAPEPKPRG